MNITASISVFMNDLQSKIIWTAEDSLIKGERKLSSPPLTIRRADRCIRERCEAGIKYLARFIHYVVAGSEGNEKHKPDGGHQNFIPRWRKKWNDETLTNALLTCDTSPALILHCQLPLCRSTCTLDKPSAFKYRMQLNYIYQSSTK